MFSRLFASFAAALMAGVMQVPPRFMRSRRRPIPSRIWISASQARPTRVS